jgi:uncharacterized protein
MKKYLVTLILAVLCIQCFAQSDTLKPDIVFQRNKSTDFPNTIDSNLLPKPIGYLNDFENIFKSSEQKALDSMLVAYEKETMNEIVVITIDSTVIRPELFYDFSLAICYKWGLGKRDLDNGILICISKNMRLIQIQNGYGISAVLDDIETKRIIDEEIIPYFRDGKFYEGVVNGVKVIEGKLTKH